MYLVNNYRLHSMIKSKNGKQNSKVWNDAVNYSDYLQSCRIVK